MKSLKPERISLRLHETLRERLDNAVVQTKSKNMSELVIYIITEWLDKNGH